jgi:hypothetical protein
MKVAPVVKFASKAITTLERPDLGSYEFLLPGDASLVWYPWPQGVEKPTRNPGYYRPISIMGQKLTMPRRTRCYGYAYNFSGQTHPLEPTTPETIVNLYRVCEKLFDYPEGTLNMCLENDYANGRECIGAHSDDERQFGRMHDVVCAVVGPAIRLMVIRDMKRDKMLEIWMPEGIYAMRGRNFQKLYSHEFPQLNPTLFKTLMERAAVEYSTEINADDKRPRLTWPVQSSQLEQAAWLQENQYEVRQTLLRTNGEKDKFDEWVQWRTSYTFRNFVE